MNQSRNSPVIRSAPGQVWNQSSSSTSNSGSIYGFRRDHQPIEQKKTSFFGLIVRVLTCKGDIAHVDEGHPQPATVPYSNPASLKSSKKHDSASSTPSVASNGQQGSNGLSFEDIRKATGDFSTSNIIGEGGFGTVYKGTLKNGSIIAIKRVKKETYDRGTPVEFKNEILTFSKIEHLNLVRFYGYIEHGDERIILVEYVSNGTLRDHLDGKCSYMYPVYTRVQRSCRKCGSGLETGERLDIMIDAMQRLKGGEVVLAMDPKLRRNPASMMVVEKVLRLARQCLAPTRQLRPSMKRCAEILWRIRKDFHEHKDVMAAAIHSVQVPQMDARKNRREFFGIEDSNNQRFQSA
ncbi:Concanavalin A-like lectin/glucanase, subgroup [Cynara cardunculus var. scolymus]|uniref:Concanavalin A-like lectin/glucanase, subgroup n=1 Tax=Cynara cardunculus var. scolymus TaxID=59895 RepID=A0A103XPU0_CYNCS|nr:Concanavalin A-like lectin/glucanase, subgroup [Cynara cardunculus var. scolymus]